MRLVNSERLRGVDMISDIAYQVDGAESVVSCNRPIFLDAPAGSDNALPQQDDIPVKCALADALDVSRGDCR